ncbi:hexamethylene bisacetamide inducible [Arctopsyche grandis]|uniref:hexamethylene bisacetamide inducible n=1 Tax=Arctopsyche grandis TaxID=121162 RepID=UPI00406D99BE
MEISGTETETETQPPVRSVRPLLAPRARSSAAPGGARTRQGAPAMAPDSKFKKRTRRGKPNKPRRVASGRPWRDLRSTHAPYNTNQFLMEEHMPEVRHEPRTRDSSFSVDSDENYFYPLPEDEEDFLTKEFSSVYEDAQSERLNNMTKDELMQEYLSLQTRYDALNKRLSRPEVDANANANSNSNDACSRLQQQEELIRELRAANQALALQARRRASSSSSSSDSEDSETDSDTSSCSTSGDSDLPLALAVAVAPLSVPHSLQNGHATPPLSPGPPLLNGHEEHHMNGEHARSPPHPD